MLQINNFISLVCILNAKNNLRISQKALGYSLLEFGIQDPDLEPDPVISSVNPKDCNINYTNVLTSGFPEVSVISLGWCELAEDDLTPENSSRAVNRSAT